MAMENNATIQAAIKIIGDAGYRVNWQPVLMDTGTAYLFGATNKAGESWFVSGSDPLPCLAELVQQINAKNDEN